MRHIRATASRDAACALDAALLRTTIRAGSFEAEDHWLPSRPTPTR